MKRALVAEYAEIRPVIRCDSSGLHATLRSTLFLIGLVLALGGKQPILPALGAELAPRHQVEVQHLLDYLGNSGCQFYRNGRWYGSEKAKAHLNKKYAYLIRKSLISTTEEFITYGASESSRSGELYQVRCGSSPAVPSGQWLTSELARYRAQTGNQKQQP